MSGYPRRLAVWLDTVSALMGEPLTEFPTVALLATLLETFDVTTVAWADWGTEDGQYGLTCLGDVPDNFGNGAWQTWLTPSLMMKHPLARWYATTGQAQAQSTCRVPLGICSQRDRARVNEVLVPAGIQQQLCMPYALSRGRCRALTLGRPESYTEDDLYLACHLQRLFAVIHAQVRVLANRAGDGPPSTASLHAASLTGRELAVLQLLARGYTAGSIGHQLRTSPRTIQKHLEHIYRKLQVSDRLGAVRVGVAMNLIDEPPLRTHRTGA